jgi:hypothetical protein
MRERWANSIRTLRRLTKAILLLPTPVLAGLADTEKVFEPLSAYVESLRGIEALPVDSTEFAFVKLHLAHSLKYFLASETGAAAYELRLCLRRVRSLSWTYAY